MTKLRKFEDLKLPQLCKFPLILTCRNTNLPVGAPELNLEGKFPCFAVGIVREDREENRRQKQNQFGCTHG